MSLVALAAPVSPTVVAFHRGAKQWSALFPRSRGIGSSLFSNSPRKRLQLRFFASGKNGGNGGIAKEISEAEKEPTNFAWPDNKVSKCYFPLLEIKPRVCILGGGFGGLYTALRLESLEWPDDNKPQ
ncbi:unnamed protein product, partial [Sphenostylis stenocarpa]